MLRIHFLASGDIAVPVMKWVLDRDDCEIISLTTQPDRPQGRDKKILESEVKKLAVARGIPVLQPEKLRGSTDYYHANPADIALVMAYGQILPRSFLSAPKTAALNLHASLLPRHRGASCVQAAIRDGDAESGVTLMHIAPRLDTGDIVTQIKTPVFEEDTGGSLHDRLAELAPLALEAAWRDILAGDVPRIPQNDDLSTYAPRLDRADGKLDFSWSAERLVRLIRAYDPWPGSYFETAAGAKIKCHAPVCVFPGEPGAEPGELLPPVDGFARIACAEGTLGLGRLQREGRAAMSAADFLRGAPWTGRAVW